MHLLARLLRRFGFVRLRDYGLQLTPDGRVVPLVPHPQLPPGPSQTAFSPAMAPAPSWSPLPAPQAPAPAPLSSTDPEPADESEEWEWRRALARAHAEADADPGNSQGAARAAALADLYEVEEDPTRVDEDPAGPADSPMSRVLEAQRLALAPEPPTVPRLRRPNPAEPRPPRSAGAHAPGPRRTARGSAPPLPVAQTPRAPTAAPPRPDLSKPLPPPTPRPRPLRPAAGSPAPLARSPLKPPAPRTGPARRHAVGTTGGHLPAQRAGGARPSAAAKVAPRPADTVRTEAAPGHEPEDLSDSVTLVEPPFPESEHAQVTVVSSLATRAHGLRGSGRTAPDRTPLPRLSRLLGSR